MAGGAEDDLCASDEDDDDYMAAEMLETDGDEGTDVQMVEAAEGVAAVEDAVEDAVDDAMEPG